MEYLQKIGEGGRVLPPELTSEEPPDAPTGIQEGIWRRQDAFGRTWEGLQGSL